MSHDRILLTLPPDARWLPLIEETTRRYARAVELQPALEEMMACSVLEACEELLQRGREAGLAQNFSLTFDFHGDAASVEIGFDGRIPLNPHLTEDYEVPDASTDLESLGLGGLWLHLIKRRMDRVFFEVRGAQHALKMVKHRRAEGEERRLWALGLSPALQDGLSADWIERDGQVQGGLLQNLQSGKVLYLGAAEALAVRRMDGRTTLYEIYLECVEALGPIAPQRMAALFESLESAGMLADPKRDQSAGRLQHLLRKIVNPVFSIPRADTIVTAIHRGVRPLVSPLGFGLCLAIGLSGLIPLIEAAPLHHVSLVGLERAILLQPWILVALYPLIMLMVAVHELGHGVVCKHYGGRVPRLGLMLYLAAFIFFCDTTASWAFPSKCQRILVSLGGPLTSFAFLGAGLWAAGHYAGTGSFWEPVSVMFCVSCLIGLAMNFNPFIRMDSYYMLMDLTGTPNLRRRSLKFLEQRLLGLFTKAGTDQKKPAPNERAMLWLYGILGAATTTAFFLYPLVWYGRHLVEGSPARGQLILGITIASLALFRVARASCAEFHALRYREYKLS